MWNKLEKSLCPRICISQYHKYSAVFAVLGLSREAVTFRESPAVISGHGPALRFCSATLTQSQIKDEPAECEGDAEQRLRAAAE